MYSRGTASCRPHLSFGQRCVTQGEPPDIKRPIRSWLYLGCARCSLVIVGGYTGLCAFIFTTPDANIGLGMWLDARFV